ncbi:MAG: ROK family protein, partial [Acidimicrobiales bacterium]
AAIGPAIGPRLGDPVSVTTDACAGAIGEQRLGAARGSSHVLYVTLGTGVGAAIVREGRLEAGAHGHAGELGHVRVRSGGRRCACGATGCLETISSAAAVEAAYAAAATGSPPKSGAVPTSCRRVAELVAARDPVATAVWEEAVRFLALGILEATTLLDPEVVVVGGGMAGAGEVLMDPLREEVGSQAASFHVLPALHLASLGGWSGTVGAGLLAWDRLATGEDV